MGDYPTFFDLLLEVIKYPPKVHGLHSSQVRESSASSFDVVRRYVSSETGEEQEEQLDSYSIDRKSGQLWSVTHAVDGRELRKTFHVIHRNPSMRLEVWVERDGDRRHGEFVGLVVQGLVDEVLRRSLLGDKKADIPASPLEKAANGETGEAEAETVNT